MEVICSWCNEVFNKKPSEAKKYNRHFCSREHFFKWQRKNLRNKVILECSNCGEKFERRASGKIGKNSFCTRKCQYEFHRGENATWYKGGRYLNDKGYVLVLNPEHPRPVASRYVYEHIEVVEKHLGRYLLSDENIHHINGVKDDNRLENLQIVTPQEHRAIHADKTKSELAGNCKSVAEMTTPTSNSE